MNAIRDARITGDLNHKPLEDPGAQIRLIYITPSDAKKAKIECTTSVYHLKDAPDYAAISYTWGDMDHMEGITLDGGPRN